MFVRQQIESGQGSEYKNHGQNQGHQRRKNRFAEKLSDEVDSARANNLAHTDFLGTGAGEGGRQVHEIDAADQDYQKAGQRKNINVSELKFVLIFRILFSLLI